MEIKKIKAILQAMVATDTNELTLETPEYKLTVRRAAPLPQVASTAPVVAVQQPQASVAAPEAATTATAEPKATNEKTSENDCPGCVEITAPIVGTFYRKPSPDSEPFVEVGDRVEKGQVVCIIEAMKLFNEIESEVSGIIRKILVEDGEPVEYGQPLFLVEPS